METDMDFTTWFETFIEEKQIDQDRLFEFVEGDRWHLIPVGVVVEFVRESMSPKDQAMVKDTLVRIDLHNGDVYHFLEYLAKGIARFCSPEI